MISIYHNPRCRKSREGLQLLLDKGIEPEVIDYLKGDITVAELTSVVDKLGLKPSDLLRRNETEFKDHFKGKELSDSEWIEAMVRYPKLIERPIVINGDKAALGRPKENILGIL